MSETVNGFQSNELVEVMLLRKDYPWSYLKELNEENEKIKADADMVGADPVLKPPSCRDGGRVWLGAIIRRNGITGEMESTINVTEGETNLKIELPDYYIFTNLNCPTPQQVHDKRMVASSIRKGVKYIRSDGLPFVTDIYPWPYPTKLKNGLDASSIKTDEDKVGHEIEWEQEKTRLKIWQDILFKWSGRSEEVAEELLDKAFAKRMMLMTRSDDNRSELIMPKPGLVFQACTSINGKYVNLNTCQWDKDLRKYEFFNGAIIFDPEGERVAEELITIYDRLSKKGSYESKEDIEEEYEW